MTDLWWKAENYRKNPANAIEHWAAVAMFAVEIWSRT